MDTETASDSTGLIRPFALTLIGPVSGPKRAKMLPKLGGSPSSGGNVPIPRFPYLPSNLGHPSAAKPGSIGAHDTGYENDPGTEAHADKARTTPAKSSAESIVRLESTIGT